MLETATYSASKEKRTPITREREKFVLIATVMSIIYLLCMGALTCMQIRATLALCKYRPILIQNH